ncbi:ATP-binding protein [Hoeflea sp. Naph1]|uniref:ATP-binding protein n=1 Tax=Hoeflea sp. Naph1 TaxID=3388653 RepID=UPI00398FC6F5
MTLPNIFDLCKPREDVVTGTIADSDYAANLANVLTGRASRDYTDAPTFFTNTYPTEGLKELLVNVCGRLSGRGESVSAVFRLDTSFGGGKTHGLIALVHAAAGMQGVSNVAEFLDPKLVPTKPVRVAAFDGENADPANGRPMGDGIRAHTPWGEIAYQLAGKAGYEVVRQSDEQRIAPGADTIKELFGSDPVLVVIDELGEYLRRVQNMGGRDQLAAFLKALLAAVESTPQAAVVYTLAVRSDDGKGIDAFADENEFLASSMSELESVSGRKATNLNPTRDDETAKVIRRRLFASIDDSRATEVINAYRELWTAHRNILSEEAKRSTTSTEFAQTYPFHPDVLDTLTGKTATLGGFQRVRGMLRILAKTVATVWANRPPDSSAIHLHHIDLGSDVIRREFTTRLQQGAFVPAILNDIAGPPEKLALAQELDATNFKGLLPYGTYVARTIFIHTLAFNNELKGVAADHLRYSILSPSADLSFIDDARTRIRAESAYLDDRPNAPLRFNAEANLTQVIGREEKNIDPGEARTQLVDRAKAIFGGQSFDLVPFPGGPWDVPDDVSDGKPRLVLLSHDALEIGADLREIPEIVGRMFERKGADGNGLRSLRNNLVFVIADETKVNEMKRASVRRLALQELKRPERVRELAEHQQAKVFELEKKSETEAAIAIQQCYRHILYPSRNALSGAGSVQLAHSVIDIQNASERPGSGQLQVVRQLQSQNKVRDASDSPDSPSYIRDRTPLKKGQMTTRDLRDEFRRDPSLSILLSDDVFRKAIRKGIEEGVYVYKRGDLLAGQGDPMPSINIDEETTIFTMDFAKTKGMWPRPAPAAAAQPASAGTGAAISSEPFPPIGGAQSQGSAPGLGEPPQGGPDGVVAASAKVFAAEGVLKEALRRVIEQAKSAKLEQVDRVVIRLFEYGDAFKLIPIANSVAGTKRTVKIAGSFITTQDSEMQFEFSGVAQDASTMKDYLEPQFRAAKETDLQTSIYFDFEGGLALNGDAADKFIEKLTRFASAAAYVEATAEVK